MWNDVLIRGGSGIHPGVFPLSSVVGELAPVYVYIGEVLHFRGMQVTMSRKLDVYGLVRQEILEEGETSGKHAFVGSLGHDTG